MGCVGCVCGGAVCVGCDELMCEVGFVGCVGCVGCVGWGGVG